MVILNIIGMLNFYLLVEGEYYMALKLNILFGKYKRKNGVTNFIRNVSQQPLVLKKRVACIKYSIYKKSITPLIKKILNSFKNDITLTHKDKSIDVNSNILNNLFLYFDNLKEFDEEKDIKINFDVKYIKPVYDYFVNDERVNILSFTVDDIFELLECNLFLLANNEVIDYIKYLVLLHISSNLIFWDKKKMYEINEKLFDGYLDVEVLTLYRNYLKSKMMRSELYDRCDSLIVNTEKQLEDSTDYR